MFVVALYYDDYRNLNELKTFLDFWKFLNDFIKINKAKISQKNNHSTLSTFAHIRQNQLEHTFNLDLHSII